MPMRLKFSNHFINWVMRCVRGASYVLLIKGEVDGYSEEEKIMRQGDYISLLLFFLCLDYLSRIYLHILPILHITRIMKI